ncbi:hypothetical protein BJY52DRAFT_224388 [Lactarius psammicola]|nr:hypothetical protein BJY52DRAFT_224388 [Lactarius psammicola]
MLSLAFESFAIYYSPRFLITAILCPLEVISTRLAVQRNHESAEFNSVAQEEVGDTEDLPEYSPDEDVIDSGMIRIHTWVSETAQRDSRRGRLACPVSRMVVDYAVWRLRCIRLTVHFLITSPSLHTTR